MQNWTMEQAMAPGNPVRAFTLPHHALPPRPPAAATAATAEPEELSPRRDGETKPEAVSTLGSAAWALRMRGTAQVPGLQRPGSRDQRRPAGCLTSKRRLGAGFSHSSALAPRIDPFYSFWLLARDDLIGRCPRRPLIHLTKLLDVLLLA